MGHGLCMPVPQFLRMFCPAAAETGRPTPRSACTGAATIAVPANRLRALTPTQSWQGLWRKLPPTFACPASLNHPELASAFNRSAVVAPILSTSLSSSYAQAMQTFQMLPSGQQLSSFARSTSASLAAFSAACFSPRGISWLSWQKTEKPIATRDAYERCRWRKSEPTPSPERRNGRHNTRPLTRGNTLDLRLTPHSRDSRGIKIGVMRSISSLLFCWVTDLLTVDFILWPWTS